ncbi:SixA phosphatase family protein [Mesorhizobium xinjiangense]|uniref:SixA phosphatase family protein n=1 Tax=Mesorhizobium xinjiangense TaxID=2678685 RepID=UPI0012EEAB93|nr:histidine phosphatase family protein [Mesorhizobium xinjiangense]
MKTLLLLRHAKSSWDDPTLHDKDRPLAPRGQRAAPLMGRFLARKGWLAQRVQVSPATRTRQTWQGVVAELPSTPPASYPEALYETGADDMLDEIRMVPTGITTLLVIGHNPGMEDLAVALSGKGSNAKALKRLQTKFPTAALARFEFDGDWAQLKDGAARLTDFVTPGEAVGA